MTLNCIHIHRINSIFLCTFNRKKFALQVSRINLHIIISHSIPSFAKCSFICVFFSIFMEFANGSRLVKKTRRISVENSKNDAKIDYKIISHQTVFTHDDVVWSDISQRIHWLSSCKNCQSVQYCFYLIRWSLKNDHFGQFARFKLICTISFRNFEKYSKLLQSTTKLTDQIKIK